ncbi:MAG: MauE/DoxX family redox-associated membrane protein [Flavobacterium sp.]
MKLNSKIKNVIIEVICLLFILLFIYAAVSKILDFENFKVQLAQSPMLSIYAEWIPWSVIAFELIIALLLALSFTKTLGLFLSLGLMTMFTVYIFILLHFSAFVPCSCGGVLEKMSWNVHLIFNCVFIAMALYAILLKEGVPNRNMLFFRNFKTVTVCIGITLISTLTVMVLFWTSEQVMYQDNPFIRRYPQHPAEFIEKADLKYSSYYFAGSVGARIYLANYKYPSYFLSMDSDLKRQKIEKIQLNPKQIPFKMITSSIQYPYFYLADGVVPIILRGEVKDWKVTTEMKGSPYFTKAVAIDGTRIAVRSNASKSLANILGIFSPDSIPKVRFHKELLQKQIDGIFDTDGTLLYSSEIGRIVYLYHYRNEFIVADKNGKLVKRGHTIDTITKAKIKVSSLGNGKEFAMSSPSFIVNANAAICGNLLFVHSKVKGRYENDKLWETSFIIDVYDINRGVYILSFPIYHTAFNELSALMATRRHLYAVIGTDLAAYELKKIITTEFK